MDTLPEWSKGVDSSSTSASCVGSNPTGVIVRTHHTFATGHSTAAPTLEGVQLGICAPPRNEIHFVCVFSCQRSSQTSSKKA